MTSSPGQLSWGGVLFVTSGTRKDLCKTIHVLSNFHGVLELFSFDQERCNLALGMAQSLMGPHSSPASIWKQSFWASILVWGTATHTLRILSFSELVSRSFVMLCWVKCVSISSHSLFYLGLPWGLIVPGPSKGKGWGSRRVCQERGPEVQPGAFCVGTDHFPAIWR